MTLHHNAHLVHALASTTNRRARKAPTRSPRDIAYGRLSEAKREMDDANEVLRKAEEKWHAAVLECDRIDGEAANPK
jgi:hypothetical protein